MEIKNFFGLTQNFSSGALVIPDPQTAPLFSSNTPTPFAYITNGEENISHAVRVFENCGLKTATNPHDFSDTVDVMIADFISLGSQVPRLPDVLKLTVTQTFNIKNLITKLTEFGYTRTEKVYAHGEFTTRGDIIDIWMPNELLPTRIMFFGDEIEAIKYINPSTFATAKPLAICEILPLPDKCVVSEFQTVFQLIQSQTKNFILTRQHEAFAKAQQIETQISPIPNYFSALSVLVPDIVHTVERQGLTALVFVGTSKACENYMHSKGIPFSISTLDQFKENRINIIRKDLGISFALPQRKLAIYSVHKQPTSAEDPNPKQNRQNFAASIPTAEFQMPKIGEVVVHDFHGLGRYLGTKQLSFNDETREYLILQYDGGAFVYVPTDQTTLLSNYHGEPTRLSRIGGQDYAAAKQRVRTRLKELTFELGELYAKRSRVTSNRYEVDEASEQQFANAFPFKLTPDQEKAIADIDADMRSNKVVDRLICGDVGVGKTEVAFRAIFRAISNGYQCAIMCPTTILSMQHFNTAKDRFTPFGYHVEVINRLVPDKQVTKILHDLKKGEVDILIGTHRLLGSDIKFKNLGMLVLDEEQRFGVGHKEQIKNIELGIDILTLSATPIPRTMHMALLGIRDISTLITAPVGRLPVKTKVVEYSDELISEAIMFEAERNGQTIILFNNVERIRDFTNYVRKLCPTKLRFGVVHGQLPERELEDIIIALYKKEIDVLVASTIVENGIDLTMANTFIAIDADRLGVAQMHQLRGRVGRGQTQAYAYFTYAQNKQVTEIAQNRLEAIQNYASAGGGLQIAMKDLQIRGAGDILGAEQSGHIAQIGFDAYCRILAEVVDEAKNN